MLHTFGDHEDAVQAVLERIEEIGAQIVVVGREGSRLRARPVPVVVVPPNREESSRRGANEEA